MLKLDAFRHADAIDRRFKFAEQVDNQSPDVCWAQLCGWAWGWSEFEDCFHQTCKEMDEGRNYCGKCDYNAAQLDNFGKGDLGDHS